MQDNVIWLRAVHYRNIINSAWALYEKRKKGKNTNEEGRKPAIKGAEDSKDNVVWLGKNI